MKKALLVALLCVFSIVLGLDIWRRINVFEYAKHESPDGRFVIRVMEYPRLFGHLPGDAGGGSGYVELVETRYTRSLGE